MEWNVLPQILLVIWKRVNGSNITWEGRSQDLVVGSQDLVVESLDLKVESLDLEVEVLDQCLAQDQEVGQDLLQELPPGLPHLHNKVGLQDTEGGDICGQKIDKVL